MCQAFVNYSGYREKGPENSCPWDTHILTGGSDTQTKQLYYNSAVTRAYTSTMGVERQE